MIIVTHIIKKAEILQKTKKFGCVGRGDLTLLFFQKLWNRWKSGKTCLLTWKITRLLKSRPSELQNYALPLVLCTFKNNISIYKGIKSIFSIPNQYCCIIFYRTDGRFFKTLVIFHVSRQVSRDFYLLHNFWKEKKSQISPTHTTKLFGFR